jgi:eukaryotic-like serine/threonine-protein kinase
VVSESETFADVCAECGAEYDGDLRYCAECGAALQDLEPVPSPRLPAGTIIGTYRLLELLGEGGMGRVYAAEHVKLGRRVALKMLRPELAANPVAVARFFAEARAVNRISHENIVEITDFLDKSGLYNCYIMEWLRGEDLGVRLIRDRTLPISVAVEIGAQVASALTSVHVAGMVHRDLKPDNIFLIERAGTSNFVKLLDFGVAKLSDPSDRSMALHTTANGQVVGTPEYMSPEQAAGATVDHRTDIHALGVILYETVTGRLPYEAKNFGELVLKHLTAPPPRPSSYQDLPHTIPPALDDLIMRLIARTAEDRPQSMAEVEERLHEIHDALGLPPARRRISNLAMHRESTGGNSMGGSGSTQEAAAALDSAPMSMPPALLANPAALLRPSRRPVTPPPASTFPAPPTMTELSAPRTPGLRPRGTPRQEPGPSEARSLRAGEGPEAPDRRSERTGGIRRPGPSEARSLRAGEGPEAPDRRSEWTGGVRRPASTPPALARVPSASQPIVRMPEASQPLAPPSAGWEPMEIAAPATAVSAPQPDTIAPRQPRREWLLAATLACMGVAVFSAWSIHRTASAMQATPASAGPSAATVHASLVRVKVSSTPPGATVRDAITHDVLGTTPLTVSLPRQDRDLHVELVRDGYQLANGAVDLSADSALLVALITASATAASAAPTAEPGATGDTAH